MNDMSNSWNAKESDVRCKKFLAEYEELCRKYNVELMSFPQFMPSGKQGFTISTFIQPVDKSDAPIPSPMEIL